MSVSRPPDAPDGAIANRWKWCPAVALLPTVGLAILIGCSGCEALAGSRARRDGTLAAYQRYLARYPAGARAEQARSRLEQLIFERARQIDRPMAYRLYLEEFPRGAQVAAARRRLAILGLRRARTAADLELVIERFPGTRQSRTAIERLARVLATEARSSSDATRAERFLQRFPGHPRAGQVREHLAALRIRTLRRDLGALEAFVARFRNTRAGARAAAMLADRMAEVILATHDRTLLDQLGLRFPGYSRIAQLRWTLQRRRLVEGLVRLDLSLLKEEGARAGPDEAWRDGLARLLHHCRPRGGTSGPGRCRVAQTLAQQASVWRPTEDLEQLVAGLRRTDPLSTWQAMARLAHMDEMRAGEHLADQLAAARIDTLWSADRALRTWLERRAPEGRRRWLQRMTGRVPHRSNLDDLQRHSFLCLLRLGHDPGDPGARAAGQEARRQLEELAQGPRRALPASFLLLRVGQEGPAPRPVGRLLSAVRERIRWLEESFPAPLNAEAMGPALLAERELFALAEILAAVGGTEPVSSFGATGTSSAAGLHRHALGLLARWRLQLRALPGFEAAAIPDLGETVRRHDLGRLVAWRRLDRRQDLPSRGAAAAICLREREWAGAAIVESGESGRQVLDACSRVSVRHARTLRELLPLPPTEQSEATRARPRLFKASEGGKRATQASGRAGIYGMTSRACWTSPGYAGRSRPALTGGPDRRW